MYEGGNKGRLYDHLKRLIENGKEQSDSKVKLANAEVETIDDG